MTKREIKTTKGRVYLLYREGKFKGIAIEAEDETVRLIPVLQNGRPFEFFTIDDMVRNEDCMNVFGEVIEVIY